MATPEKKSSTVLPKISRKLAYRTLALVIVVGGMVGGLEWFIKVRSDLGILKTSETAGWIAALEYLPEGQIAVLISPDGKVHKDPGYKPNSIDRDLAWSPKGNFLYFVSDRVDHNFNLFRWSPGSEDEPEQRTIGTRSHTNLRFPAQPSDDPDSVAKGLITMGGLVQEFDPVTKTTQQTLPPTSREITQSGGDESGTEGEFEGTYGSLGSSFRDAQWCGNKRYIAAVMRRESGEILILQDMQPVDGKVLPPKPLMAGDHVDFAINPKTGGVVYCVQNFHWPSGTPPNGKDGNPLKKPFVNGIGSFDFSGPGTILAGSPGDKSFASPAISPDGNSVVYTISNVAKGEETPYGLGTLPTTMDPQFKRLMIAGDFHEPSWSPDGTRILVAVTRSGKARTIFEISLDGSPPRNITGDTGEFGFPLYSPQQK